MPKSKPRKSAAKRFTLTGTGKIKRKKAYHSHILTKKSNKRKRNLAHTGTVHKTNENLIRDLLAI